MDRQTDLYLSGFTWSSDSPKIRHPINITVSGSGVELALWVRMDLLGGDEVHKISFSEVVIPEMLLDSDTMVTFPEYRVQTDTEDHGPWLPVLSDSSALNREIVSSEVVTKVWVKVADIPAKFEWKETSLIKVKDHLTRVLAQLSALENAEQSIKLGYSTFPEVVIGMDSRVKVPALEAREILMRAFPEAAVPGVTCFPTDSAAARFIQNNAHFFHSLSEGAFPVKKRVTVDLATAKLLLARPPHIQQLLDNPQILASRYSHPVTRFTYAVIHFVVTGTKASELTDAPVRFEARIEPWYKLFPYAQLNGNGIAKKFSAEAVAPSIPYAARFSHALKDLSTSVTSPIHYVILSIGFANQQLEAQYLGASETKFITDTGHFRCAQQVATSLGFDLGNPGYDSPMHAWNFVPALAEALDAGSGLKSVSKTAAVMAEIVQTTIPISLAHSLWRKRVLKITNSLFTKTFLRQGYDAVPWAKPFSQNTPDGIKGGYNDAAPGLYRNQIEGESQKRMIVYLDYRSYYPSIFMELDICFSKSHPSWPAILQEGPAGIRRRLLGDRSVDEIAIECLKACLDPEAQSRAEAISAVAPVEPYDALSPIGKEFGFLVSTRVALNSIDSAAEKACKLSANGCYGAIQNSGCRYFCPEASQVATMYGRTVIQLTREIIKSAFRAEIIYTITDSILFRSGEGAPVLNQQQITLFCRALERMLGWKWIRFSPPEYYQSVCVFTKNKHCWLPEGEERVRREFVRGTPVVVKSDKVTPEIRQTWLELFTLCLKGEKAALQAFLAEAKTNAVIAAVCAAGDGQTILGFAAPESVGSVSAYVKRPKLMNGTHSGASQDGYAGHVLPYWESNENLKKFFGMPSAVAGE